MSVNEERFTFLLLPITLHALKKVTQHETCLDKQTEGHTRKLCLPWSILYMYAVYVCIDLPQPGLVYSRQSLARLMVDLLAKQIFRLELHSSVRGRSVWVVAEGTSFVALDGTFKESNRRLIFWAENKTIRKLARNKQVTCINMIK